MKIKVFYYIDKQIEDPDMLEKKKAILEIMNKFDQYIEYEKFDKEYKKIKASLIYKKNKDKLSKKRKVESVFCNVCNKSIQKKAYYESHVLSPFHLNNKKEYEDKMKNKKDDGNQEESNCEETQLLEEDEISEN